MPLSMHSFVKIISSSVGIPYFYVRCLSSLNICLLNKDLCYVSLTALLIYLFLGFRTSRNPEDQTWFVVVFFSYVQWQLDCVVNSYGAL